jgi:hypothetical protein
MASDRELAASLNQYLQACRRLFLAASQGLLLMIAIPEMVKKAFCPSGNSPSNWLFSILSD